MKKILLLITIFAGLNLFAQPGKNGSHIANSPNQVLNKYCPVAQNISAGSSTVILSTGPGFSLCPGDLIMVYQAQGCTIDQSNSNIYGAITAYNSAGLYEFKYVQTVNGNTITTQTSFTNSYAVAGRVQVVKVPQYTSLTINAGASVVAKDWKDTTILGVSYRFGGLVVLHATNIINNGVISASGFGFRGGQIDDNSTNYGGSSYVSGLTTDGGEKGESIFGYQAEYDLAGGRFCRGGAANGGGGGVIHNSAAGGGANGNNGNTWSGQGVMIVNPTNPLAAWALDPAYIANGNALTNSSGGGRGGYSFGGSNQDALVLGPGNPGWGGDSRREVGGLGGRPLTNINAETRIYFGGGGGAGDANNNCTPNGASGGGIVYLIATTGITGNGTIISNGNTAGNSISGNNDASSAGGAGGSIVIKTGAIANTQVVNANGGNGGNQLYIVNESEGAGGGGGGGFVSISGGPVVPTVNGGLNGNSQSTSVTEMTSNGATQGAVGQTGTVSTTFITYSGIPSPVSAAPTTTQASCTGTNNAFDLGLTFPGPTPGYTITWSPVPAGVVNFTQSAGTGGIAPGIYNATITTGGGCVVPLTTSFSIAPTPAQATVVVNPSYSVTCTQTLVVVSLNPFYTYTWTNGVVMPITGTTATFSPAEAGTWTVTGVNASGCSDTQTFSIGQNTTAPTNSVNPTLQAITCATNSAVTFTGTVTSPTINVQHDWYSPLNPLPGGAPIATSNNTITILSGNIPPGTYTLVTTNLVNGCTSQKTVTITSLSAFPTFSVSCPTNYSVGCVPLNQTTINIVNPQSTQSPSPATCSFTFLPPGFAGVVTPSVVLGGNTSTMTQLPGTWTVIVQDNSNFCRTILSVPIVQNTVAPHVLATILQQTLTCYQPTLLATGTSTTPNTIITWGIPVPPNQLSTPTVEVGPANGPNTSSTSLTYANYTVIATNTLNACLSTSVMVINQNFKPPVSSPTISIGTPTAIYCAINGGPVILTTGASTTTSGGGPLAFAIPYLWQGPSPQLDVIGASSYGAFVAGTYTLIIKDNYNGCLKTGTINVLDKTQPPVITNPINQATIDCGSNQASLITAITGPSTGLMYWYYQYPLGTAFSPSHSPIPNGSNPYQSGTSATTVNVSKPGYYEYVVSNTLTGCQASGTFVVTDGDIIADFDMSKYNGYAPLTVNFNNNSISSLSSNSITSVWSFGNGTSQTTTTNISTSTVYNSPGTYTVFLYASKGKCLDTTYKILTVDIPSKLEPPNVFTPNGDNVNDVFFLKVANLTEVTAVIFDRWGNKVYDVTSSTGNIAWDGKSLNGKECPAGVYFYIIKAKGKDEQDYDTKGNVTLFR